MEEAVCTKLIPWRLLCVLGWQWWSPGSPGCLPCPQQPCQESGPSHSIPGGVVVTCALWFEWKQLYSSGYGCPDEV